LSRDKYLFGVNDVLYEFCTIYEQNTYIFNLKIKQFLKIIFNII